MTRQPKVVMILPVYNRREQTREFLKFCRKAIAYPNYEIIVVDGGSTDGTWNMLRSAFPWVCAVGGTGWVASCINTGIFYAKYSDPEYVWIMTPDVTFYPDLLSRLVEYAEGHPLTLVGPTIYRLDDGRIWSAGVRMKWLAGNIANVTEWKLEEPECMTGLGQLIPFNAFRDFGRMDDRDFPQQFSDIDFALRAKRAGYHLAVLPDARLWNDTEDSAGWRDMRKVTPKNFFVPLYSKASAAKLRMRITFYHRYWPWWGKVPAFLVFYGIFFFKRTLKLMGRSK